MPEDLKILIVENDKTSLDLIKDTVKSISGVTVTDTAGSNTMARLKLKHQPVDIVLLSLHVSDDESIETLREVRRSCPDTEVLVMSSPDADDARGAIQALEMGALEHLKKPAKTFSPNDQLEFRLRLMTLFGLVQNRKNVRRTKGYVKKPSATPRQTPAADKPSGKPAPGTATPGALTPWNAMLQTTRKPMRIDVVVIAVSTGGPNALATVIPKLPGDLGVPILLVQHMPANLTASLAESLNARSPLTVREAVDGEPIVANTVYIAPGGKHMIVNREKPSDKVGPKFIGLNENPPQNSVRPSADVLFDSVARVYDGNILAIVMTGMGSDGLKGVSAMKQKSCYCLTQSEDTCVVYGMPRAIDEASLSDQKMPLEKLAESITDILRMTG